MKVASTVSIALGLLAIGAGVHLRAQVAVTSINYGDSTNYWNSYQGGISFRNESYTVDSVGTAAGDYQFNGPLAQDVYIRRNQSWWTGPNNTTLFYQVDSYDRVWGSAPSTASEVFTDGNLFTGLRDPFANTGSSSSSQNTNIERIDFYFGDYVVQEGAGIVLFDLENFGNQGDAFRIAAFDGWDSSAAAPDSFANTGLLIGADSFGEALLSPTDNGSLEFARATYDDGDDLTGYANNFTQLGSDLNLVGILIRFTDLGMQVGDTIQGFSLMAADVNAGSANDLVNWNNSSVYRTDTDRNLYGNVDFMGFGAQMANPIPEPSTYGAVLMLTLLGVYGRRRWLLPRARALKRAA
ncbi:PEP-CTERM sorting domain-containing protein [Actomonas aquatica]|uniref:PEP-CTERM sorting domain-containing protein n=1 Tax=Actomonas aquatica TaxID=2866162 RepID=A0ABZ1CDR6_9BACT|nr:PEP-CTERM sorting domain-containing protein [Opitutus sp. WL0086]WRQ89751.1 PEP-CTERM sorting domain-containing protein [Opitutus sp. WL0086]